MPDFDETNRGVLFTNDRKEKDTHADLNGKINVEGKEYWLNGWTKRNEDGTFKLVSLSVKPKEPKAEPKKDWASAEVREKFNKPEETVLDDIDDEPVDLSNIPF